VSAHPSFDRLADYLAGLLTEPESDELEEHLFSCESCAGEAERVFALAASTREAAPPVLSTERFETFSREGRVAVVNPMAPGEVVEVRFPPEGKLLVHRLGGSDLSRARRVDLELLDLEGSSVVRLPDVPFDAGRGEVFLACQRHFADRFPHDLVVRVEVIGEPKKEEAKRYTILHRL
jgi:Putative zinc-finger